MIHIAGAPRSLAEMDFVAGMRSCEACGDRRPLAWMTGGSGAVWTVTATCARCSTVRTYAFETEGDLLGASHPPGELGGREPSRVIDPHALMHEIDRLAPAIVVATGRLVEREWSRNFDRLERVQTALAELAKFIPDGEAHVPPSAHRDAAGIADAAARPERYARPWIASAQAHWRDVAAELASEAPRVLGAPGPARRGFLDPPALAAHSAWLRNDPTGEWLDVVGIDARGLDLTRAELDLARLEAVRLVGAPGDAIRLVEAQLVDVDLGRAAMAGAVLAGAVLARCTFDGAQLTGAQLDGARLAACTFVRARLARASLRGVQIADSSFAGAVLAGASLAGAELVRCDLRDVDFTACDLSNVAFVACLFAGARGTPAAAEGCLVAAADFSRRGDGSDLGDAGDLLDYLR